ncbi:hypothetical protein [uncultured Winogradskyella sp.]|uniref:hypothetical protein n=1 Tax=uncultured Winogradskyella sp. TaxID=395353 RepID=UPI00262755C1|nr:hypothetical protein [uncultured Winogradskyella sp.]
MNEMTLTEKEKLTLEKEIESNIAHRKKQILNFCLYIIGGILISLILRYWNSENITSRIIFAHILIGFLMLIPISFAYYLSQRTINKLKTDLRNGKKIIGIEKVKSINFFNRTITLANGIKVYETSDMHKKIKKGDLIKYTISPSNEYQFDCIKN